MRGKEKSPAELEYLDKKHRKENKKGYIFEKLRKALEPKKNTSKSNK